MRYKFFFAFALLAGFATISTSLFAHHGNAAFDTSQKLTLKGTVTEWFWANPHCFLKFDAKDEKGEVIHWVAETSNPPDMVDRGWSKQSIKPGDEVAVTLQPVKNGKPIGRVLQVVLPNGKVLGNTVSGVPGGDPGAEIKQDKYPTK